MKTNINAALVAAAVGLCLPAAATAETIVDKVRVATERFTDVNVAINEGYGPIPCASGGSGGSMGVHFVNGGYLTEDDNALDISKPEAVMYEPQADGSFVLVGVEYITFAGPASLDGHLLRFHGAPNSYGLDPFYELHVWAHRDNPAGPFAGMNKTVSCAFAEG